MNVWKKARAMFLAGILSCSLAACNAKQPGIELVENTGSAPEYLSFFSTINYADTDIAKYWSDRFAEKYEQRVYISHDGAEYYADKGLSYRELLEKRLKSSSPDDLYIINAEDVMDFEKKGYWMDLSVLDCVDNLSEAALYQSICNGKVFSIPLSFTGFGFYWNLTVLKEHGLSVPNNLEEFLTVCETLKANGVLPYGANKGFALTVPVMCMGLPDLYTSDNQEQRIADLNSGATPVSTYMRKGFEFLRMMIEKGYLDPQQALDTDPNKQDFTRLLAGECAFICTEMTSGLVQKRNDLELELTGLPLLPEGCIAVYGASMRLAVNPNSKHLDTALKFMEMVGATEALDESAIQARGISCAKNTKITVPPMQQKLASLLQQPGQIPNQDFALHFNTWENVRNTCREICRGYSVQEACDMLDELQRAELQLYAKNQ